MSRHGFLHTRIRFTAALAVLLGMSAVACASNVRSTDRASRRRAAVDTSHLRPHAGGDAEGPLGVARGVVHSAQNDLLIARGTHVTQFRQADPETRDEIMRTFTRSLGVRCDFCHAGRDYEQMTPRVAVAANMWLKFVRSAWRLRDGSQLYCDSCHAGSATFLPRNLDSADARATIDRVMQSYVREIVRPDGRAVTCESCHGEPFHGRFLPRLPLQSPTTETLDPSAAHDATSHAAVDDASSTHPTAADAAASGTASTDAGALDGNRRTRAP